MAASELTPLMKQYWQIKSAHQDKILLFRMGDFFEMFHDDAIKAAPILGIALTSRNKKSQDETPMCGVPHHSIAGPIQKLLEAGLKIAICDQIEDPQFAKGIVKRAVTRILSPGMIYDPDTLAPMQTNYLASFDQKTFSVLEPSTGEAFYFQLIEPNRDILRLLQVLRPAEIVLDESTLNQLKSQASTEGYHLTAFPELAANAELPDTARRLMAYAVHMQGAEILKTLSPFVERTTSLHMELNSTVVRHLEIFETYKGEKRGALFHAINRTKTSAGARLLRSYLNFPLMDKTAIQARQGKVQSWMQNVRGLENVREVFKRVGDIERRLGKVSNPGCNGRDLKALSESLNAGLEIAGLATDQAWDSLSLAKELVMSIDRTLIDDPPLSTRMGYLVRAGFQPELDDLIELSDHSQKALLDLEQREKAQTGIPSLKVRYNQVFGYYIEVTNTHRDRVPANYQRKQTLANAERFVTEELLTLERKILSAKTRRSELEYEIFENLRRSVLIQSPQLLRLARQLAELDVLTSLAWLALEQNYTCPQFSEDASLELVNSRHPVVEQEIGRNFVANTLRLKPGECLLLTGPNMAGKSTLMRQIAISALMAQIGSFIPAERACLPLFSRIFTRIGASDFIAEGLSTFMVEMQETAEMLNHADARSLVLLDEVGRGTSTYDGMSLAQAILEHLLQHNKGTVLFATHYHELTSLDQTFPKIQNGHMSIREKDGKIYFLHTLVRGPALRSYGIHVAKLAGLPEAVTIRAQEVLKGLERVASQAQPQLTLFAAPKENPALDQTVKELRELNISHVTPLEAMNKIAQWQQNLS